MKFKFLFDHRERNNMKLRRSFFSGKKKERQSKRKKRYFVRVSKRERERAAKVEFTDRIRLAEADVRLSSPLRRDCRGIR